MAATREDGDAWSAAHDRAVGELRSFGRRRGRKFSSRQDRLVRDLLPGLSLDLAQPVGTEALAAAFRPGPDPAAAAAVDDVWLEIGFGGGEHLIWQARNRPNIGFIGAEPFEDGVVKVLAAIEDGALGNIRLHAGDAREVLRWLPEGSIGRAFVLFPDPWPKRRHVKRRLVNASLLARLAHVMRPGAELRLATDIGDYARTMLMAFQQTQAFRWLAQEPRDWRERPEDWPLSRYGEKAAREGRRSAFLRFERV